MKRTTLQTALSKIAPHISIRTHWGHDPDMHDIREECDGMDDEDPDDWQAWMSEVRAACIQDGEEVTGSDYLGGTWEKSGDIPEESNPTISGYEPDMTQRALEELRGQLEDVSLISQIDAALAFLETYKPED